MMNMADESYTFIIHDEPNWWMLVFVYTSYISIIYDEPIWWKVGICL